MVSFMVCLVILVSTILVQSSLAAPLRTVFRATQLGIIPMSSNERKVCVDNKERFAVLVVNDYGVPIPGATVHANKKTVTTNGSGYAIWYELADSEGTKTITINATKAGYFKSSNLTVTFEVIQCSWVLRMDYGEEFADVKDTWVFQGSVEIEDTPFMANTDGTLFLVNGESTIQAQYRGSLYELFKPIFCFPQPELSGVYPIQLGGKYKDGFLTIKLSATPVKLPSLVEIQCSTLDPNYIVEPFNYPTGQKLDLVNAGKLNEIFCPGDGCVKRFKLSRVQLWPFDTANYASGVLIIEREKK